MNNKNQNETKTVNDLTLSLLVANLLPADNLCKQFGPKSGPDLDLYRLIVCLKEFFF